MLDVVLAQTTLPVAVPDWIPPVVVINLALAGVVIIANMRGIWVSGREHDAMKAAKDKEIANLKSTMEARLVYTEERRVEERDARIADARTIGILTQAGAQAVRSMESIGRDPDTYAERDNPRGARRQPGP